MLFRDFISDDSGALSLDWIVLTAALVGTGIAVVSTVSTGIDGLASDTEGDLNGAIIRTTFVGDLCEGGVKAVQAAENARVEAIRASGLEEDAVNVKKALEGFKDGMSDEDLLRQFAEYQGASLHPLGIETTHKSLLECEIQRRGLL